MPTPKIQISFADFCDRHDISRRDLSDICGGSGSGASKSQMQRFIKGELDAKYTAKLRQLLADNLPNFLFERGFSSAEIDHELLQIFDKGEYQPMINQRKTLPLEVAKYFGFNDLQTGKPIDPFSQPPRNKDEVFVSPAIKNIVSELIDAIKYQKFIFVSGEIGSGKTVVRNLVEENVNQDESLRLIFPETFDMSKVTPGSIARAILEDFDIPKVPVDSVSRAKAVKKLLAAQVNSGVRIGIGVDEVHRSNDITVSSYKNLLEMNSGGFQRYLGILLFGQPQFETRLSSFQGKRDFREIYERLTIIKMPDFKESAMDYLTHRLALVSTNAVDLFDSEAIDLILRQSNTPLQLGNIVNQALILSANTFKTDSVKGAAIKTKMHFAQER